MSPSSDVRAAGSDRSDDDDDPGTTVIVMFSVTMSERPSNPRVHISTCKSLNSFVSSHVKISNSLAGLVQTKEWVTALHFIVTTLFPLE